LEGSGVRSEDCAQQCGVKIVPTNVQMNELQHEHLVGVDGTGRFRVEG